MTNKSNNGVPLDELHHHRAKKGENSRLTETMLKVPKRTRHSFYLDTEIVRCLDQAYKQAHHELYPRETSKSEFLEQCIGYALSHLNEIKRNLSQNE